MSNGATDNDSQEANRLVIVLSIITLGITALQTFATIFTGKEPTPMQSGLSVMLGVLVAACGRHLWIKYNSDKMWAVVLILFGAFAVVYGVTSLLPKKDGTTIANNNLNEDAPPPSPPEGKPTRSPFEMGRSLFNQGDYKQAVLMFKEAIKRNQEPFESNKYLGLSYAQLQDYEAAKAPLQVAFKFKPIEIQPLIADVYYKAGLEWLRKNNKDEARRQLFWLREYARDKYERLLNEINNR